MAWQVAAIVLGVATLSLGTRLLLVKHQARQMAKQLRLHGQGETRQGVTLALMDQDMNALASAINDNLASQEALLEELLRGERSLRDAIAGMSHDLRTPLTSVLGYLQLARQPDCADEQRTAYLQVAHIKAESLRDLINRFYELSVLEAHDTPLVIERIDLNAAVLDVLAGQYALFHARGIEPIVRLPDAPVWVSADRTACTRIAQNLLQNALRCAKGTVCISLACGAELATLSICNAAPNLKPKDLPHLFERFYTADDARSSGSAGLGLYIVKMLLARMGCPPPEASLQTGMLNIQIRFGTNILHIST